MLDFTSALYLGLRHPSSSLRPWSSLTTGAPAALTTPPDAPAVAREVAALMGCEHGLLTSSTLHLFWDLFGLVARRRVAIYMDSGIYPIVRWGVERAAARGVPVKSFAHFNPVALENCLRKQCARQTLPIVVTDGFCPGCGKPAPLVDYLEAVRMWGGHLIIDDTQALGILGNSPEPFAPYGKGGGGTLRWSNVNGPDIIVVASLAKAFGVPVALLAGSRSFVKWFEEKSETRVHCSPPSVASIRAAEHALEVNREQGDTLRLRLAKLVRHFQKGLSDLGVSPTRGMFPVQTLALSGLGTEKLYLNLARQEIRTVLQGGSDGRATKLSVIITALHTLRDIDCLVTAIRRSANGNTRNHYRRVTHETWIELQGRTF